MYWTLELASWLEDAPWPATKDELIDYANRSGLPEAVLENLQEIEEGPCFPNYPQTVAYAYIITTYAGNNNSWKR